jgi:hypothetical protein
LAARGEAGEAAGSGVSGTGVDIAVADDDDDDDDGGEEDDEDDEEDGRRFLRLWDMAESVWAGLGGGPPAKGSPPHSSRKPMTPNEYTSTASPDGCRSIISGAMKLSVPQKVVLSRLTF